ncbi:MAG: tyrosine-type recombinase/integrase [Clostridiales bacterium]|nr:tyrosine-type recombinase/integrase [Clostridiales bacterium]
MTQLYYRDQVKKFEEYLINEEKSSATIEKYMRDVRGFLTYISGLSEETSICKEHTVEYKKMLSDNGYAPVSINSMLTAVNGFLKFCGFQNLCVKLLKIQRQIFCREERELGKVEYRRLIEASRGTRLFYIIRAIGETGIRVSELQYITVEAVRSGRAQVRNKNKIRVIFIPKNLQAVLKKYIAETKVKSGSIFVTKGGKPINRSNIWRDMKSLCKRAGVSAEKVFPHNLRHLFARTFYSIDKDIVRLADILGHSSIDTTRIYTVESGAKHILGLERVQKMLTT